MYICSRHSVSVAARFVHAQQVHWLNHSLHSLLTSDDVYKICQCKYFSVSKLFQYAKSLSLGIVVLAHSHSTGVAKV